VKAHWGMGRDRGRMVPSEGKFFSLLKSSKETSPMLKLEQIKQQGLLLGRDNQRKWARADHAVLFYDHEAEKAAERGNCRKKDVC